MHLTNPYWQKMSAMPRAPRKPQPYKPRPKKPQGFIPLDIGRLRCSEITPRDLTLLDLGASDCRYPTTDDRPFLFCGQAQQDGFSYCPGHLALSWRRMT
jgi:hypothetical protein